MNLSNTQPNSIKRDAIPVLQTKADLNAFIKAVNQYCNLNHGEIGQNVVNNKLFVEKPVEECPHYNSRRKHSKTGKDIPHSRKYQQEKPPSLSANVHERSKAKEESGGGGSTIPLSPLPESKEEDDEDLELTEDAQRQLNEDTRNWKKEQEIIKADHRILKNQDDSCASMIVEHVSPVMMREIEINPLFEVWRKLSFSSVDRSVLFMRLLKELFSSGNASDAVEAMMQLFAQKQDPDQNNPSTFINQVADRFAHLLPLIEDKSSPGMINANQLQTMVLIHGLNKTLSANKDGIKTHLQAHPKDALVKTPELIAALMKAYMSDMNEERVAVSEQSAAFAAKVSTKPPPKKKAAIPWKWHADNPDNSEIAGLVHCTNCHKINGKFHYQHSLGRCSWTAEREKAYQARRAPKLQAKAAAVEAPAPAPAEASEVERLRSELTQAHLNIAFYAGHATRKDQLDA